MITERDMIRCVYKNIASLQMSNRDEDSDDITSCSCKRSTSSSTQRCKTVFESSQPSATGYVKLIKDFIIKISFRLSLKNYTRAEAKNNNTTSSFFVSSIAHNVK